MQVYSKALVVLPYISVVAEKTEHLTTVLKAMKCKVKGYFGTGEGGVPLAPRSGPDPDPVLPLLQPHPDLAHLDPAAA